MTTATARSGGTTATAHGYSVTTKPVCFTPCVVDLQPGLHALTFASHADDRASGVDVQVGDSPKIVRHAMGSLLTSIAQEKGRGRSVCTPGGNALLIGSYVHLCAFMISDDDLRMTCRSLIEGNDGDASKSLEAIVRELIDRKLMNPTTPLQDQDVEAHEFAIAFVKT